MFGYPFTKDILEYDLLFLNFDFLYMKKLCSKLIDINIINKDILYVIPYLQTVNFCACIITSNTRISSSNNQSTFENIVVK